MKRQFTGQSSWYLLYICNRGPHCSRPTVIPLCTSPRTNSKSKQERRGVPPLAETAMSAPLKVPPPPPRGEKIFGAASGAARVDAGS